MTHEAAFPDPNTLPQEPTQGLRGFKLEPLLGDPSSLTGNSIHEDTEQLAASIARIAESPDTIHDYMRDVLMTTDGSVPADERRTAFESLAGAQKHELNRTMHGHAMNMYDRLSDNNKKGRDVIAAASGPVRMFVSRFPNDYQIALRQATSRGANGRQAAEAHSNVYRGAAPTLSTLGALTDSVADWKNRQVGVTAEFTSKFNEAKAQGRALDDAAETLKPDYVGEQRDLAPLIDDTVIRGMSEQLHAVAREAAANGSTPQAAIQEALAATIGAEMDKKYGQTKEFADQFAASLTAGLRNTAQASAAAKVQFQGTGHSGTNRFQEVRSIDDLSTLVRKSTTDVMEITEKANRVVNVSNSMLQKASEQVAEQRKQLQK